MALPTTQKEVTTRRIASLISGLWNKVKNAFLLKTSRGAASGVASLDANGKVPTSQLPQNIPYATNAHRLQAAYATFNNTTGYRLLAEIHPVTGISANSIATFDALFTHTANSYSLAHVYVNIRTNYNNSHNSYVYYWCYIDKKPAVSSRTQICAYTKTGSNSLFLFAHELDATYCGVQLTLNQTSDYDGKYKDIDVVDLKQNDTLVTSLDSSYTQVTATYTYYNVLAATSQVGSASVPVYIKSNGTVDTCTVGSSNGLASLDANGKVPTGNLPSNSSSSAGIVASGSGQQNRVWGTDSNGNPSWSKVRANMLESNINISGNSLTAGRSLGTNTITVNNKKYKFLGKVVLTKWVRYSARFQIGPGDGQRNCDVMINVQRNANGSGTATELDAVFFANTDGSNLSDLGIYTSYDSSTYTYYFYLGVFNSLTFVRCLYSNGFSFDAPTTTPSSLTRIANNRRVILGPSNSGVGSESTPIFMEDTGTLKPCALPQTISFSSLSNTPQQRVIARLAYVASNSNSVMTLMVTQGEGFGQKDSCGIYFVQASYRGTPSLRTTVINSGSSSGSHCTFAYYTGSESGTNYMYIVAKRPQYSASMTVMQIGAFELDGSMASPSKKIYDGGNVSSSGLTDGTVILCAVAPSGGVGNGSTPIFMENTGTLKPCTGGSLINYEVTSAVPSSPTAGKFYFIS